MIKSIGSNTFVFSFPYEADKRKILLDKSWHFNKSLIVFEQPRESRGLSRLQFQSVEFWVQIRNILIVCMSKRMGLQIGKMIGEY